MHLKPRKSRFEIRRAVKALSDKIWGAIKTMSDIGMALSILIVIAWGIVTLFGKLWLGW